MTLKMDVVVDSAEPSVDMKSGLDSFQGVSDATRKIAETILTEKVPQRLNHKSKVRTTLKRTFTGSYGQMFDLNIYDETLRQRFKSIGRPAFIELMQYFFKEALYEDFTLQSKRAQNVLDKLGDTSEELVKELRVSALENIHQVSLKFHRTLEIRFRKSRENQISIGRFDESTAEVLEATEDKEDVDLVVSITRLNINTGNGRLKQKGAAETVAFGFSSEYKAVRLKAKKLFSANLDYNNGLDESEWNTLQISARPIRLKDGKIIKYIVKGYYE